MRIKQDNLFVYTILIIKLFMDDLLWNLKDFILFWFLSLKWKCPDWQLYCLKSHLSFVRICSILFIKQCMFLVFMKNTVHFFSMKTISKTYSNNNMIHFIIWCQTMSSSQNMSNRIKDKRFTKAILESWLASEVKTKIFLIILFLFPSVFYLLVIKAPPQRYLYILVFVSFL